MKKGKYLFMGLLLAAAMCGGVFFAAAPAEKAAADAIGAEGDWLQRHTTSSVKEKQTDGTMMFATADGDDMAFIRQDDFYKIKEDGFYMRFTMTLTDTSGDPVLQPAANTSMLRLQFSSDSEELGNPAGKTQLVVGLMPYYDTAAVDVSNQVSNRTEAAAPYYGHKAADNAGAYSADSWFFGTTYGGELYTDGVTPNTILLKYVESSQLLWICLNDFWYTATNPPPSGYSVATPGGNNWAGGQGQAHTSGTPNPNIATILDELDAANGGEGAAFGFWFNHLNGNEDDSTLNILAMGSPEAPVLDGAKPTAKTVLPSAAVSVNLKEYFSQPNGDTMAFTAVEQGTSTNIGSISAAGVWTYTAPASAATKVVTFKAVANNANLGAASYFPTERSATFDYTLKAAPAVTAGNATALTKECRIAAQSIADLTTYFNKGDAADTLTFSANVGTVTGNAWAFTPTAAGAQAVTITANDGRGSANITFTLTVLPKIAAKNAAALTKSVEKGTAQSIADLSEYFTKGKTSDTLTFTATVGTVTGSAWAYTPDTAGAKSVSITATDSNGDTATISFTLTVTDSSTGGGDGGCGGVASVGGIAGVSLALLGLAFVFAVKAMKKRSE